jgi:hypothetical protein
MKRIVLAVCLFLTLTAISEAKKYPTTNANGQQVIAHTNKAPVAVHRVLPPYGIGKHVYAGK